MADLKISALPASTTPLAGTEVLPIVQGGQTRQVAVSDLTAGRTPAAANFINGYTAVVSAAGTTTLTATSTRIQKLSGSTTQTFQLPSATTVAAGTAYLFDNDSTGLLTVTDGSGGAVTTVASGTIQYVFLETAGTTAGSWGKYAWLATNGTLPGDLTLSTGNLIMGTSGKGIDFSAVVHSGSTSKLLADYEVGSWTPADNSGAGLTFTVANGRYVKVGSMITCWGEVGFPATANASAVNISGLPFTVPNAALYRTGGGGKNNAGQALYPQCNVGTATIGFIVMSTGGGVTNVQMTGSTIYFTATYPSSLI